MRLPTANALARVAGCSAPPERPPAHHSVAERAAVLAVIGGADQHTALPIDADRLTAAERMWAQSDIVAARRQPLDCRRRDATLDLSELTGEKHPRMIE